MKGKFLLLGIVALLLCLGTVHAGGNRLSYRCSSVFGGNRNYYQPTWCAPAVSCYGYSNYSPCWYSVSPLLVYYSTGDISTTVSSAAVTKVPPPVMITTPVTESSVTYGWRK